GRASSGTVTVTNVGDSSGAFTLSARDLLDSTPSARLSRVLDLRIEDVTARTPRALYTGKLADLVSVRLGTFAQGAAHRYRFTVAFPGGRSAALDAPYQGVRSSVTFTWLAVGVTTPPTRPAPTPAGGASGGAESPAPVHSAQSPGSTQ